MRPLLVSKLQGFAFAAGAPYLTTLMWQVFSAPPTASQTKGASPQKRLWVSFSPLRQRTVAVTTRLKPRDRIVSTHYTVIGPETVDNIRSRGGVGAAGVGVSAADVGGAPPTWVGHPKYKAPRGSRTGSSTISAASPQGFRNLQNNIHQSLLRTGGFKHHLQPSYEEQPKVAGIT